jgi:thiol-disulfide isomerase/thioredoxin
MIALHVKDKKMRKILRFTASWCAPCQIMARKLEEVNILLPIEVFDIDTHPEIASEFGIRSVPTLVMTEENIEVKRMVGTSQISNLKTWLEND